MHRNTRRPRRRGRTGISELPVELLTIIFFFYANIVKENEESYFDEDATLTRFRGSVTNPMTLTKVCRHWRQIAMNLPALWSSIYISQPIAKKHFEIAQFWIYLSQKESLDLTLRCTTGPTFVQAASIILGLFSRYMDRWQRIEFRIPFPSFQVLDVIRGPLPRLEHACVYTEEQTGRTHDGVKRILDCIYSSPRLRSAVWASGSMNGSPMFYPQTLRNLTKLALLSRLTCVHDVFLVIRSSPQLRSLTLNAAKCDRPNCAPIVPTVHGRLQDLRMRFLGQDPGEVLHLLALPALQSLELGLDKEPSRSFLNILLAFFNRSRCLLRRFRFRSHGRAGFTESELMALLVFPSLQTLEEMAIWQEEITGASINLLNLDGPTRLMPKLVRLELSKCVAQDKVLGCMLMSRRRGIRGVFKQVERVDLGQKSPQRKLINGCDKEMFKNLVASGLRGRLTYSRMDYENEPIRPYGFH